MQKAGMVNKCQADKQRRVALLGDSILDNEAYVASGKAVIDQINRLEKEHWYAELLAVDGATTEDIPYQCLQISDDISHLIISIGGNDALGYVGVFEELVSSVYEGMQYITEIRNHFRESYRRMLREILSLEKKIALCTIYNSSPGIEAPLLTALSVFNDVIFYEAFRLGVPVLDFRQTFTKSSDYSSLSPIEPSENGGRKIAEVVRQLMEVHDFSSTRSVIYY